MTDLQALIVEYKRKGWEIRKRKKSGHIVFVSPDPAVPLVFTGSTPGDRRAVNNLKSLLERKQGANGAP